MKTPGAIWCRGFFFGRNFWVTTQLYSLMQLRIRRFPIKPLVAFTTALSMLAMASTAAAAAPDFGGRQLKLPNHGSAEQFAETCSIGANRIRVAGQFGGFTRRSNLGWPKGNRLATFTLPMNPKRRAGKAIGKWRDLPIPRGEIVFGSTFASSGELVYVTARPLARGKPRAFHVLRSTAGGRPDRTFGRRGMITLSGVSPLMSGGWHPGVRVLPTDKGTVIVLQNASGIEIHRVSANGVDRKWKKYAFIGFAANAVSVFRDGSVFAPASVDGSRLTKLRPDGSVDTGFGVDGFWVAPQIPDADDHPLYSTLGMVRGSFPAADGGLLVAVANSRHYPPDTSKLTYRFAKLSPAGVTESISNPRGEHSYGRPGGYGPISSPFIFGAARQGAILAHVDGWFSDKVFSLGFVASTTTGSPTPINQSGFAATALASSPNSTQLLVCGVIANQRATRQRKRQLAMRLIDVG